MKQTVKQTSRRIKTQLSGCVLRPWTNDDMASLVFHGNNRKVWRNLTDSFPHPYTEEDAEQWITLAGNPGTGIHLAIDVDGQAVGSIGIVRRAGIGRYTGQLGYWLGEAYWARGLATAAVRALSDRVLERGRFRRLEATVLAWNPASMRVLEKAAFVREAVLRERFFKDEEFVDCMIYGRVN